MMSRNIKLFNLFPKKFILLITIIIISYHCVAQRYNVTHYTEADGLGNTLTYAIKQDSNGIMWFATRAGITSYDGSTWNSYNTKDGLARMGYAFVEVDEKGNIWALPSEGHLYLTIFNGDSWENIFPQNSPKNFGRYKALSVYYENEEPVVVVATKDNGVLVNRHGKWIHYTVSNGLLTNEITGICFVNDSIFVASNKGINILYKDKLSILDDLKLNFPDNNIIGICNQKIQHDEMGRYIVWVAGKDWLGYISDQEFTLVSSDLDITISELYNSIFLVPDQKDGIYYGNEFSIMYFDFDTKKTSYLGQKNGLISEGALSVFIDREKNAWIAGGRGVNKISSKRFGNFNKENGLFDNEVTSIVEIRPGSYVFGHIGALTYYEDGVFDVLELSYSSMNWHEKRVMDMCLDNDRNLWFAAGLLGIGLVDKNKQIKLYRKNEGFPGFATSVISTSSGKIYACSNEGFFVYSGNKFEQLNFEGSWDRAIRKIFEAKDGSLYCTTYDKGIYKIKDGIPVNIKYEGEKGFNNTYSMWEDPEGDILIGSARGILKVEDSVLVKYNVISLERPIYLIMNDHKGQLWIGSDNGIYRWDGSDLEHFSVDDGLAGQEINRDGGLLDANNNLWFGTNNGVTLYQETYDNSSGQKIPPPKIALSFVEVESDTLSLYENITLDYNSNDLTFNFKGISFIDENQIYYKCKLDGFEENWSSEFRSLQNSYRYFNIEPGEYKFCIKARNALGIWSDPIRSNLIIIKSPFWFQWWFITLITIFIVLVISVISRFITQKRYTFKLEEIVQNRTKELNESNKGLTIAKERVEESETRFKALHNASFGGIAIHDKGIILECNQGLSDITGYTIEELIGMNGLLLIAEESNELVLNNISTGYEKPYEAIGLRKNGSKYPIRCESRNVPYKGKMVRTTEFRDITNQKNAELEIIKAKEQAEESDRLKSAFLANMSHEIRTPMNGILGFAELLKEPNLTGEKQQKYIGLIEKGGARMLNIINDIVSISKIESGQMEIHKQESNINEQIEFIYTFFKPEIDASGMRFSFRNHLSSEASVINTDREKVYAILTNLVKNAIKYTEKGSIEFGYNKKDKYLEFYVKDTGIGIPKNRQKAIFERFIQADIAGKNAYQGAGLGLSISKSYVEMLGGKIWVQSEEDKGSVFYFTLPYHKETIEESSIQKEVISTDEVLPVNKLKILIVEDDKTSELLISIIVMKFATEIINVRNGKEAVETCLNSPNIDLVLMDIQMPDMDGYEATRQIRKFNKDVIIIAQTAYALEGDMEKAYEAGCNDYITKPINSDELEMKIRKFIKKK